MRRPSAIHFAGQDPIGSRVSFNGPQGPWCEIVGIVRDSKYAALGELPLPVVYMPVAQNHETGMTLYVRASVPPGSLIGSIRHEIQAIEPNLPVPGVADDDADDRDVALHRTHGRVAACRIRRARAAARGDRDLRRPLVL